MIAAGKLGKIRKVVVEYPQGWLATRLEASGQSNRLAHRPKTQRRRRTLAILALTRRISPGTSPA